MVAFTSSILGLIFVISNVLGQNLESPCPGLFKYQPLGPNDDTWTGELTFTTDTELSGIWLRIILDSAPIEVTSEFGEVVQREASEYLIRRPEKGLKIGGTETFRMSVKFDRNQGVPKLLGIRLNARVICPENGIIIKPNAVPENPIPDRPIPEISMNPISSIQNSDALNSPCPDVFQYEPVKDSDRWYGTVNVKSDRSLTGVTLKIVLDSVSLQLGNWFGEVSSPNNKDFTVTNVNKRLQAGEVLPVRFFMKFKPGSVMPKVRDIFINGKSICARTAGSSNSYSPIPAVVGLGGQVWESPCPNLFQYNPIGPNDDTWTGTITIKTDTELSGVWLRIVFDSPPIEVTSNFGEAVQREASEYLIRRPEKGLKIGISETVDITVKFNKDLNPPKLVGFRLNARVLCPDNGIISKPDDMQNNNKPCVH